MRRARLVVAAVVLLASPASADIKVTTVTTCDPPRHFCLPATVTMSVKGDRVLIDTLIDGEKASLLIEIGTGRHWLLHHASKEFSPVNPWEIPDGFLRVLGDASLAFTPSGETREIGGRHCRGFSVAGTVPIKPLAFGLKVNQRGHAWVAVDGPAIAEYSTARRAIAAAHLQGQFGRETQPKAANTAWGSMVEPGLIMERASRLTLEGPPETIEAMGATGSVPRLQRRGGARRKGPLPAPTRTTSTGRPVARRSR